MIQLLVTELVKQISKRKSSNNQKQNNAVTIMSTKPVFFCLALYLYSSGMSITLYCYSNPNLGNIARLLVAHEKSRNIATNNRSNKKTVQCAKRVLWALERRNNGVFKKRFSLFSGLHRLSDGQVVSMRKP